jgi:Uma2 family endonuclease
MSTLPKPFLSPEEYLEIERKAEFKSEYFQGEMYAMSGARSPHTYIAANIIASLHQQLRQRDCMAVSSEMRVRVSATGLCTYPDIVAFCGEPQFIRIAIRC